MGKGTMNCKDYKTKCGYYLDKQILFKTVAIQIVLALVRIKPHKIYIIIRINPYSESSRGAYKRLCIGMTKITQGNIGKVKYNLICDLPCICGGCIFYCIARTA